MRGCRSASGWRTGFLYAQSLRPAFGHFAQGFVPALIARELLLPDFRLANAVC